MKKRLFTALIASALVLSLGTVALAGYEEAPAAPVLSTEDFTPGAVPAQTDAVQAMSPALHGIVLAAIHQGADHFHPDDIGLAWESLYNMLSLYGQMDNRSAYQDSDTLLLLRETVQDYAAALDVRLDDLGKLPAVLNDRMTYDPSSDSYQVVCGNSGQAQFLIRQVLEENDCLVLSGALVSQADSSDLARFQAVLRPLDNMFGYSVAEFALV